MKEEFEVYVNVQEVSDNEGIVRKVVGICDKELLGKTFKSHEITLVINEEFFRGFEASLDEAIHYLKSAYTAMIVGQKIVNKAIEEGLIHPESVIKVDSIPYAQIVRM